MGNTCREPDVAVIIPCYNARNTISKTLDSVLSQTYKLFKIYVVNDGSTDDTLDILHAYQKKNSEKIYVVSQQNQGQAAARNKGIQSSQEAYIAFIDSDDLWHPEKLEKQRLVFAKHDIGMCYTQGVEIDEQENQIDIIHVNPSYRGRCFEKLIISNNIVASSVMIRRSVLDRVGMFDTGLGACENWDLWLRISRSFFIDFLDEPLTSYRIHSGNMSQNSDKMYKNREKVLEKHLFDALRGGTPDLIKTAYHRHHKLFALQLIQNLRLTEARKQLLRALTYNRLDAQLYKLILKTCLGKTVIALARKLRNTW